MPTVNSLNVKIGADITSFNKGIEDVAKKLKSLSTNLKDVGKSLSKNITAPLVGLGAVALKLADDDKRLRNEFIGLTGSIEGANEAMKRWTDFSKTSPFKASDVAGLSKAIIQVAGNTEDAFKQMEVLQRVASATGASLDFLGDRMLKIAERGKVDNRSFERMALKGIPATQLLADSLGVTTERVRELADEGRIGADTLMKAFEKATSGSGRFAGALDRELNTISGAFNNIRNRIEIALGELGEVLADTFDFRAIVERVGVVLNKAMGWFKGLNAEGRKTVIVVAGIVAGIGPAILALGALAGTLSTVAGAMAVLTSPIALTVGAIAGLGALAVYVYRNWEAFKERWNALWFGLRYDTVNTILEIAEAITGLFAMIPGIGHAFAGVKAQLTALRGDSPIREWEHEFESFGDMVKDVAQGVINSILGISTATKKASEELEALSVGKLEVVNKEFDLMLTNVEELKNAPLALKEIGDSFPIGSINAMNAEVVRLTELMNNATNPEHIKAYAEVIRGLQGEIRELTGVSNELGQALQTAVTSAIQDFATTLGNVFTGDAGAKGFFNNILLIVADFGAQFGKALIAAGIAAQAFQFLLTNPLGAIMAGTALVATSTAVKNILTKNNPTRSVNDALITSNGQIVEFHPDDNILAMKDLSGITGGAKAIQVQIDLDGRQIYSGLYNTERKIMR